MLDVVNLQQKVKVDVGEFRSFSTFLISNVTEAAGRTFTVAFVADDKMRQLNELFRDKDVTTDVLSFPREPDEFDPNKENLGDIVISVEQAKKQAVENSLTLEDELKQLVLHGLLHLCGYDHETDKGEMNTRELELREALGI